jgi:hypothetical protein
MANNSAFINITTILWAANVGLHELANIAHKLHDGRPDLAVLYDKGFRGVCCRGGHGALEVLASAHHLSSTPSISKKLNTALKDEAGKPIIPNALETVNAGLATLVLSIISFHPAR